MRIRITGTPDNVDRRTCCRALRFYAQKMIERGLLHPLTLKSIVVSVSFPETLPACKAELEVDGSRHKFKMSLRKSMSEELILASLAHEFVHVCQYASRRMEDVNENPDGTYLVRWMDREFLFRDDQSELYWFSPWELEARAYERGLYMLFRQTQTAK